MTFPAPALKDTPGRIAASVITFFFHIASSKSRHSIQ